MADVTTANFIAGPADIYIGAFGATEPNETAVGLAAVPSSGQWRDLGGTAEGLTVSITQEFFELACDQILEVPGRRPTKRDIVATTNLAEPTLENLAVAMNAGSIDTATSGVKKLSPVTGGSATTPNYKALIVDGGAPDLKRRRVVFRKTLSTGSPELAYKKDAQTFLQVQFASHYVSTSIKPYIVLDETA